MKILYIGCENENATSRHRANALRRIGNDVTIYDPEKIFTWSRIEDAIHFRSGYVLVIGQVERHLFAWLKDLGTKFDVAWVDGGHLIGPKAVVALHEFARKVINYNCDDPTGTRDGMRWFTFKRAIPFYDLCVVVRGDSEKEYPRYGSKRIFRVWMSADEIAHAPRIITPEIYEKWKSDVAFVGTWMPERGPFMMALVNAGVPLSIWGNRWQKAKEWSGLKSYWRGPALAGDEYAYAIQCAKINLGLLSKGNRDLHTQRSAEIPALGALLCAERTTEHEDLFEEAKGAYMWKNSAECVDVVMNIIKNPTEAAAVAKRGSSVIQKRGLVNQTVVRQILNFLN